MHQEHGSLYSNLSINEFGTSEQEDDFFKSLLASKDGYWEKTLIHDKDNEKLYEEVSNFLWWLQDSRIHSNSYWVVAKFYRRLIYIAMMADASFVDTITNLQCWYCPIFFRIVKS